MVNSVNDIVAVCKHSLNISAPAHIMGAEISLIVGSHRAETSPVVFRMYKDGIVLRSSEIKHRFQHLILYLDQLHGLFNRFF